MSEEGRENWDSVGAEEDSEEIMGPCSRPGGAGARAVST